MKPALAYTLSGLNPDQVYAASDQLVQKLREFRGFATVRSDHYNNTPDLTLEIDRERAANLGVSTAAVESLLRTAYSQNYVYLMKEPDDQYQVILEAADNERSQPADLNNLYVHGNPTRWKHADPHRHRQRPCTVKCRH